MVLNLAIYKVLKQCRCQSDLDILLNFLSITFNGIDADIIRLELSLGSILDLKDRRAKLPKTSKKCNEQFISAMKYLEGVSVAFSLLFLEKNILKLRKSICSRLLSLNCVNDKVYVFKLILTMVSTKLLLDKYEFKETLRESKELLKGLCPDYGDYTLEKGLIKPISKSQWSFSKLKNYLVQFRDGSVEILSKEPTKVVGMTAKAYYFLEELELHYLEIVEIN